MWLKGKNLKLRVLFVGRKSVLGSYEDENYHKHNHDHYHDLLKQLQEATMIRR